MRSTVLLPAVVLLATLSPSARTASATPSQIHLSIEGSAQSSMTVTWRSTAATGTVRYAAVAVAVAVAATAPAKPEPEPERTVTAASRSYHGSHIHHARLSGLRPATRYRYQVGGGGRWSASHGFVTAPADLRNVRFIALGDTRSNDRIRRQVARAVAARQPAFVLHTGDLVTDGRQQYLWDRFFATTQPQNALAPLMPAIGNHEHRSPRYFSQFALPTHQPRSKLYAPEAYYSFDYGLLHVIALCTEPVGLDGGVQARWLAWDLAKARANSATPWIIVMGHRGPYSSGPHGDHKPAQRAWVGLFEQYAVPLTFWGHDHGYQRSKPLRSGKPAAKGGVTYVVTAGAGAPLYEIFGNARMAVGSKAHHFVEVEASAQELRLRAMDIDGKVIDRLTLRRPTR